MDDLARAKSDAEAYKEQWELAKTERDAARREVDELKEQLRKARSSKLGAEGDLRALRAGIQSVLDEEEGAL